MPIKGSSLHLLLVTFRKFRNDDLTAAWHIQMPRRSDNVVDVVHCRSRFSLRNFPLRILSFNYVQTKYHHQCDNKSPISSLIDNGVVSRASNVNRQLGINYLEEFFIHFQFRILSPLHIVNIFASQFNRRVLSNTRYCAVCYDYILLTPLQRHPRRG